MHRKLTLLSVFGRDGPGGVIIGGHFDGEPLVFDKVEVVVHIHDGVFALGEGYAAEGVAVAKVAIEKNGKN